MAVTLWARAVDGYKTFNGVTLDLNVEMPGPSETLSLSDPYVLTVAFDQESIHFSH